MLCSCRKGPSLATKDIPCPLIRVPGEIGAQHKDPGHAATDRGGSIATTQFQFYFIFLYLPGRGRTKEKTNKTKEL